MSVFSIIINSRILMWTPKNPRTISVHIKMEAWVLPCLAINPLRSLITLLQRVTGHNIRLRFLFEVSPFRVGLRYRWEAFTRGRLVSVISASLACQKEKKGT